MISSLWPPSVLGGAELYAARLAERLRGGGFEVGALTLGVDGPDVVEQARAWPYGPQDFAAQPAAKRALFHLRDLYNVDARRALGRAVREYRPDVVHSHAIQGLSSVVLSLPSRVGIPHVHTIHDYWLLCQRSSMVSRSGSPCERRCRPCAAISFVRSEMTRRHAPNVLLAVSEAVAREHAGFPWVRDRVRVVYNPTDQVTLPERAPGCGPPIFGYLGRLTTTKGVHSLLDAFSSSGLDGARLRVAGDGPLRGMVERAGPAVEYLGWIDDACKDEFLAGLDCLVVPSEWKDPAPLVINEAVARRLPVIGARAGGIPELVPAECEPLLFRAGDPRELRGRLVAFAATPDAFRYTDAPAAALDWPAHLERVTEAYRDAIGQRSR